MIGWRWPPALEKLWPASGTLSPARGMVGWREKKESGGTVLSCFFSDASKFIHRIILYSTRSSHDLGL